MITSKCWYHKDVLNKEAEVCLIYQRSEVCIQNALPVLHGLRDCAKMTGLRLQDF